MMGSPLLVLAAAAFLIFSQPEAPKLSRSQRAALLAIVQAIDNRTSLPDLGQDEWPIHVLRASDGSHYVAFSVSAAGIVANHPNVVYVRLATRGDAARAAAAERSAVAEWLAGQAPGPLPQRRGIAFGEMPTFGAGAIATRGPGPQSLQLLEMERERVRERREAEERQRKATLEGAVADRGPRPFLPFEDFDVQAVAVSRGSGPAMISRSLTAGPGEYDLVVGWADPEAKNVSAAVQIVRRRVSLPPASTSEFGLSSVIIADSVAVRDTPLLATEQTSRPYTIGPMEIVPAADHTFTNDETLSVVVQVINPHGSPIGKPDVAVAFRLFRNVEGTEEIVGSLAPQTYNATTLPPDFDVAKRHPIFAAVAVPLRTFKRGEHRLEIAANDRIAGTGTATNTTFKIVGTPAALLRDAPPLARPFRRETVLSPALLNELLSTLSPSRPSATLSSALESARAARFVELIRDEAVTPEETSTRHLLRTLALYAIGDTAASLTAPLQQALQQSASAAATHILIGAVRALERNDRDAVTAWNEAIAAGASSRLVSPLMVDALLRQGDARRALEVAQRAQAPDDMDLSRRVTAAYLALGRLEEAVREAEALLKRDPDDPEGQWLALHVLFARFAAGAGANDAGRARIAELAGRYVAAKGPHAALALEWAAAVR